MLSKPKCRCKVMPYRSGKCRLVWIGVVAERSKQWCQLEQDVQESNAIQTARVRCRNTARPISFCCRIVGCSLTTRAMS